MKVKMLTAVAGEIAAAHGEIIELEDKIASAWVAAGMALEAPAADVAQATIASLKKQLGEAQAAAAGHEADASAARAAAAKSDGLAQAAAAELGSVKADLAAALAARDAALADVARLSDGAAKGKAK